MKNLIDKSALKITIIYLIFGCAWIFFSDILLLSIAVDEDVVLRYQTYKGWMFIFITSVFLFFLLQRHFNLRKKVEEQLFESHQSLRNLTAHQETVREEERVRIAREIHDELGQALTGLKMDVIWIKKRMTENNPLTEKFDLLTENINSTIKTVRKIASELRPVELDDLGLVAALESESEDFETRTEIKTLFHSSVESVELPRETAVNVFRVYQEALTNIVKHSEATKVTTDIWTEGNRFFLKVEDNGRGITEPDMKKKSSFGLLGMKERARISGGEIKVFGNQDKGSVVLFEVPI